MRNWKLWTATTSLLYVSATVAAQLPLSCQMQSMLAGLAAMARDQGKSPSQVKSALMKDGELTNAEVNALIEIAFVRMKKSTPDEISQTVALVCKG